MSKGYVLQDNNGLAPVAGGGTGSSTASDARTALGLAIGTNVQAQDATLQSISALGTAADRVAYTTGVDTWAETPLTSAGRDLIDDATAGDQRTTLGLGTIATQAANNVSITGGSVTGITDLVVADGGTGASTFTDAGVLLGNGTGAIQVTTAGTAGQVLTSNGAGVDPTFQAVAASSERGYIGTIFETAARFSNASAGAGAITFGPDGITLDTSTTITSYYKLDLTVPNNTAPSIFTKNPTITAEVTMGAKGATFNGLVACGSCTTSGAGITYTGHHFGFKIVTAAGTATLYGTQADGTTEATTSFGTINADDHISMKATLTSGSQVVYRVTINRGAASTATISTNLPSSTTVGVIGQFSASNVSTTAQTTMYIHAFNYYYDI